MNRGDSPGAGDHDPSLFETDGGTKALNIEVPDTPGTNNIDSEDAEIAYVNIHLPADLYRDLFELKEEQGTTWRGLLMRARTSFNGYPTHTGPDHPDHGKSQYDLLQDTRKRYGLTWKGMLLEGARYYDPDIGPPHTDESDSDSSPP